jgi:hypothetical protein
MFAKRARRDAGNAMCRSFVRSNRKLPTSFKY